MTDAIKWTWTIVNAGGVVFLAFVLRELWQDRAATRLPSTTNGRRGIFVYILMRHSGVFLAIQGLFTWAGIVAIQRPNVAETDATVLTGLIAIVFAIGMDVLTLLDLRDRARIRSGSEQRAP